jgi:hypothetical protein
MKLRIRFNGDFESWIEKGFNVCGSGLFKDLAQRLFGGTEKKPTGTGRFRTSGMQNMNANCNTGTLFPWMNGFSEHLVLLNLIKMVRYSEYWLSEQGMVSAG